MGKFFVKLFKYFLTTFLICLTIITVSKLKSYTKNKIFIDNDELTIGQMIHNSMADVDNYLFNRYGFYMNYSCITTHNYGLLSCENVNQSTLKNYYNNLYDLRFDLNSDNIINDNDN